MMYCELTVSPLVNYALRVEISQKHLLLTAGMDPCLDGPRLALFDPLLRLLLRLRRVEGDG